MQQGHQSETEKRADAKPDPKAAMESALELLHATGAALVGVPAARLDIRPLAAAMERAIVATLDAFDARREPAAALVEAAALVDGALPSAREAADEIEGLDVLPGWLERSRGWLLAAVDGVARAPVFAVPPREVVVSGTIPSIFRISRASIAPVFRVAAPVPPPPPPPAPIPKELPPRERLAEAKERAAAARERAREKQVARAKAREARRDAAFALETPPRPGFVKGEFTALTREQFVRARARELFDEVSLTAIQRTPLLGDDWRSIEFIDRRMMRAVDALAGLGGEALAAVERLVVDAPAKDPSRAFAVAFSLGCFEGRDALAAIERALRYLGVANLDVRAMAASGLKRSPNPELEALLRRWSHAQDAGLRAIGFDVLGHKGLLTEADLDRAFRDTDLDVVAVALSWAPLGPAAHRTLARAALHTRGKTDHPRLAPAAAWALAIGGYAAAFEELAASLGTEREPYVLLPMALLAEEAEAPRLVGAVRKNPTAVGATALGFLGSRGALEALIDILADSAVEPPVKQACAFALQRLTGLEVFDDVTVPPEKLEAEEPADPATLPKQDKALARIVGDPRDQPADGAADEMKLPTMRVEPWREYLRRESDRYTEGRRFRRGEPYVPATSLDELMRYAITPPERRALFRELIIKTGEVIPFDTEDFVAMQKESLDDWAPIAAKASSQPGSWGYARRKDV